MQPAKRQDPCPGRCRESGTPGIIHEASMKPKGQPHPRPKSPIKSLGDRITSLPPPQFPLGIFHQRIKSALSRFKRHRHSVPGKRRNHPLGISKSAQTLIHLLASQFNSADAGQRLWIHRRSLKPLRKILKPALPECFHNRIATFRVIILLKKPANIHPRTICLDRSQPNVTPVSDMHLEVTIQLQPFEVRFQSE